MAENGSPNEPNKYVVFDAQLLLDAELGSAMARSRDEATRAFADQSPDKAQGKVIAAFTERQVSSAFENSLSVKVENRPVVATEKINLREASPPAED